MKLHPILCLSLVLGGRVLPLQAQTNVFPAAGNVGVGTANPTAKLHVLSGTVKVEGNTGNVWNDASIYSVDDAAGGRTFAFGSRAGAFSISDETSFAVRFLIDGSGNAGIGTWAPRAKLDVNGNILLSSSLSAGISSEVNALVNLETNYGRAGAFNSAQRGGAFTVDTRNAGDLFHWRAKAASTGTETQVADLSQTGDLRLSGVLVVQGTTSSSIAGNVGIGTTAPTAKLSVNGTISQGNGAYWTLDTGAVANDWTMIGSCDSTTKRWLHFGYRTGDVVGGVYTDNAKINFFDGGAIFGLNGGNVGIGTTNPTQKLSVAGTIQAKEVIVQTGWSDYVFDESYRLAPLSEIEQHIKAEKHLPGIPSAAEVAEHGVSMGEMQAKLLAKVEELTLHQIEQEKLLHAQHDEINQLKAQLARLNQSN